MRRAIWLVMDSVGVGGAPDAARFGDEGADTLGHIADWCARPAAAGGRGRPLALPNLVDLGLGACVRLSTGRTPAGLATPTAPRGLHGVARERSTGKDTISGHWEMAGLPVDFEWGYFHERTDSIPAELLDGLGRRVRRARLARQLPRLGHQILRRLGEAHTSPAASRSSTPRPTRCCRSPRTNSTSACERLYALCEAARRRVDATASAG
jgi:phosphopentomutase